MKRQRGIYGVGAVLFVVLLVAMRSAASWRPRKVAFVGVQIGDMIGAPRSRVVANGRILLVECSPKNGMKDILVARDTSTWQLKRQLPLLTPVSGKTPTSREAISCDVSPDGQEMATIKSLLPQRQTTQSASPGEISSLAGPSTRPLSRVSIKTSGFTGWDGRQVFTRFSPNGQLVGVGLPQKILFWNGKSGALVRQVALPAKEWEYGSTLILSPDFKTAISSGSGHIRLWDIQGEPRLIAKRINGTGPLFSPDGKRFVYRANGNLMLVCGDAATGKDVWAARLSNQSRDITWSRDGNTVFALDSKKIFAFATLDGALLGSRPAPNTVQILPSPVSNEVWRLDLYAQLWSQRVY